MDECSDGVSSLRALLLDYDSASQDGLDSQLPGGT